jgi:hypothetical protein
MTSLQITLDLPNGLAREAQAAGLLTPTALRRMLRDEVQRRAAQVLLSGAARGSQAGAKPLSMRAIQAEVKAVRRERQSTAA